MDTPSVTAVLNQLLVRYRRGAALHVGLSAGLGLGCVGLVVWRLVLHGASRSILWGIGATGVMSVVVWQWRFLRREWLNPVPRLSSRGVKEKPFGISTSFLHALRDLVFPWYGVNRRQLVAQLDESLGLKARLLTAVEFADAPEPPALYARLLEETTTTLPAAFRRLPPVVDRRMVMLAVILLLLWVWPRSSARLTQLAMHPPSVMPPESPPTESREAGRGRVPAHAALRGRADSGRSGSPEDVVRGTTDQDQRQDRSGSESSPSSSGQSGQTGQQDSTRNSSQSGAQSSGSQDSHGSQASQTSPSQSDRGSQPDTRQAQQQSSQQAKASSGSQDQGRQRTPQKQQQAAGAQQPGSSAQQELLKGDIQQLLKELSSELKQMQTELEAAQRHDQPNPMPGTSTDPNLYGDLAQAKQAAGNRLPIQLEVDTQPTASTRRGGGVGTPSTEIADTLPQQQPEEATLSDVRTTETGVAPQPIPPEYRPVFERLSRQ